MTCRRSAGRGGKPTFLGVAILGGLSSLFALLVPVFLSIRDVGVGRGVLALRERELGHGHLRMTPVEGLQF